MLLSVLLRGARPLEQLVTTGFSSSDPLTSDDTQGNGNRALAGLRIDTDGQVSTATGNTGAALVYSNVDAWVLNLFGPSSNYEARVTNNSETGAAGSMAGNSTGVWVTISSNRDWTWEKDADTLGTATLDITIEIREIADTGNIVTYSNYIMNATESV